MAKNDALLIYREEKEIAFIGERGQANNEMSKNKALAPCSFKG